jgi:UDP-N-acetylglucosamine--N-acetylmuramyl-(pentapeptide) pyrophosphoryl-undecaprenol N-acetylglucosamine transferase
VNAAVLELMGGFGAKHENVIQIHATGRGHYDAVKAAYDEAGLREEQGVRVVPYLPEAEMPDYMAACDVILCRAGALTLTEIALSGCCAILIPSPNVTGNHQYKNARVLADGNGAILLEETQLEDGAVIREVEALYGDPARRAELQKNIGAFADPAAGGAVWRELTALLDEKGRRGSDAVAGGR